MSVSGRNHLPQIIWQDADVAVVHQQNFVARSGQHLRQIADFDICSQNAIAHDQLNREIFGYFACSFRTTSTAGSAGSLTPKIN